MPLKKLKDFLDQNKIKYELTTHSPYFTSQEVAAAAHVSGRQFAKTVIVKADGKFVMVVLPANEQINFAKLKQITGSKQIDLATEIDFKDKFSECEVGAMPPFGNLYDMPVYVSNELRDQPNIVFNAGSHSEVLTIAFKDFERLVNPEVVEM